MLKRWSTMISKIPPNKPSAAKDKNLVRYDPVVLKRIPTSSGPTQKLGPFFSLFLMRKTLSSGQKWFLRPYFPQIRGMFLLKSGLRFSFRALEVPEPRVRKRPYW